MLRSIRAGVQRCSDDRIRHGERETGEADAGMGENSQDFTIEHYVNDYDHRGRWSSYWLQIEYALAGRCMPILEIGIGNGVVSQYLGNVASMRIVTIDIDDTLGPDVVADVGRLPLADRAFERVICCEVLEHMPLERAVTALHELRRVSSRALISVPNGNRGCLQAIVSIGSRRIVLPQLRLPRMVAGKRKLPDAHFWEIDTRLLSRDAFADIVADANWSVEREFRNPDHPYHHFWQLR